MVVSWWWFVCGGCDVDVWVSGIMIYEWDDANEDVVNFMIKMLLRVIWLLHCIKFIVCRQLLIRAYDN